MESNHVAIGVAASVMRGAPIVAGAHPASVIVAATAAAAAPRKRRAARPIAASVRGFR